MVAAIVFCVVVWAVYPYYQYYVDTDATAYLTISQRYADGEFFKAINGYWSPWACWLTAIGIKWGIKPFLSALVVNGMASIFFLLVAQSFFVLLGLLRRWQFVLMSTIALFLSYAVFKQSFDDIWECFFLLAGLRLLLVPDFKHRPDLWIWLGISGGFAYYAKAYAFPFFILNTLCCTFYITNAREKENRKRWLLISASAIVTLIIVALPWMIALHHKYGVWMTSTAGSLNLSWYPVGHPFYKEGITYLLPPVYGDSPSYWEDPWMVNGHRPYFWHSGALFARQMAKVVYNMTLFVKCLNEMSPFLFPTMGLALVTLLSQRVRNFFGSNYAVVALSFLLFPLGFVLINFESRYIWYMFFPGLLLGAMALQKVLPFLGNRVYVLVMVVFAVALLVWPVWDMKQLYRAGQKEYKLAQQLQAAGVKGSFTANVIFGEGDDLEEVSRLAYFSGNPYYNMPVANIPYSELLADVRRYGVNYYFYYHKYNISKDPPVLRDERGAPFPVVLSDADAGLTVFKLR